MDGALRGKKERGPIRRIKHTRLTVLAAALLSLVPCLAHGRPVRLVYGFRSGQSLNYVIERQDSVWLPEVRSSFLRVGQRMRVLNADDRGRLSILLSADSLWQGADTPEPANGYEKMLLGTEIRTSETDLVTDVSGSGLSGRARFIPFLFPLPKDSVAPDGSWRFELRMTYQVPFKGELRLLAEVQFYEVTLGENGESLAVLALRLEKENRAALTVHEPFQTFMDRYDTHETGSGVCFFNLTKGRMERGVIRWTGTVSAEERGRPRLYRKKSRISFRIDETR
jgi:hypothetical protein